MIKLTDILSGSLVYAVAAYAIGKGSPELAALVFFLALALIGLSRGKSGVR